MSMNHWLYYYNIQLKVTESICQLLWPLCCRLPLSVSFTPCREGYVSFRLVLRVKRKSEPLALTVKADCFTMRASVQVENPGGGLREISPNHQDTLDFGKVSVLSHHRHKYSLYVWSWESHLLVCVCKYDICRWRSQRSPPLISWCPIWQDSAWKWTLS